MRAKPYVTSGACWRYGNSFSCDGDCHYLLPLLLSDSLLSVTSHPSLIPRFSCFHFWGRGYVFLIAKAFWNPRHSRGFSFYNKNLRKSYDFLRFWSWWPDLNRRPADYEVYRKHPKSHFEYSQVLFIWHKVPFELLYPTVSTPIFPIVGQDVGQRQASYRVRIQYQITCRNKK